MQTTKLSLLIFSIILTTCLPTYAQQQPVDPPPPVDLIGVGTNILNNILNPPHRAAEINADVEIKKAKIAADAEIEKEKLRIEANKTVDKVALLLNKWGVSRVSCAPGVVFINGIAVDTVCVQPNQSIPPGYYSYDSEKQQLIRSSHSGQFSPSTPIPNPAARNNSKQGF